MRTNATFSVIASTAYLLIYCLLLGLEGLQWLALLMFMFSPFVLCWMIYSILKYDKYSGRELSEGEEYGYEDV